MKSNEELVSKTSQIKTLIQEKIELIDNDDFSYHLISVETKMGS